MKFKLLILAIILISFTGCTNTVNTVQTPKMKPHTYEKPTSAKAAKFNKTMVKVALSTQDDSKYTKMALDTPEKKVWFKDLMYRLWDRQITRNQFIEEGLTKYPTRKYEFTYVANGFQRF